MFSKQASEQAIRTKESLERLLEECRTQSNIDRVNEDFLDVTRRLTKAATLLEQKKSLLEVKEAELNQPAQMSMEDHKRLVHPAATCSANPCPLRDAIVPIPPDPEKPQRRALLSQDIERLVAETTELAQQIPLLMQQANEKRQ